MTFAGRVPGYEGLDQINIQIPSVIPHDVIGGSISVIISNNYTGTPNPDTPETSNMVMVAIQ